MSSPTPELSILETSLRFNTNLRLPSSINRRMVLRNSNTASPINRRPRISTTITPSTFRVLSENDIQVLLARISNAASYSKSARFNSQLDLYANHYPLETAAGSGVTFGPRQ